MQKTHCILRDFLQILSQFPYSRFTWAALLACSIPAMPGKAEEAAGTAQPERIVWKCAEVDGRCFEAAELTAEQQAKARNEWSRRLGAVDFAEREAASGELRKGGEEYRALLESLLGNDDPEVASRARTLLAELNKPNNRPPPRQVTLNIRFNDAENCQKLGLTALLIGNLAVKQYYNHNEDVSEDKFPSAGKQPCMAVMPRDGKCTLWFGPCWVQLPKCSKDSPLNAAMIMEPYDLANELNDKGEPLTAKAEARLNALARYIMLKGNINSVTDALPPLPAPILLRALKTRLSSDNCNDKRPVLPAFYRMGQSVCGRKTPLAAGGNKGSESLQHR